MSSDLAHHAHTMDLNDPHTPLYLRLGGREKIRALLDKFYAAAGEDPVLGPVFNTAVEDWSHHMDKVTDFWVTQCGGPVAYQGGMGRHVRLGLEHAHFLAWLALWEKTCRAELPEREATELVDRAKFFAGRIKEMSSGGVRLRPPGA